MVLEKSLRIKTSQHRRSNKSGLSCEIRIAIYVVSRFIFLLQDLYKWKELNRKTLAYLQMYTFISEPSKKIAFHAGMP